MSAFFCWPPSWQDCLHTNHSLDVCMCLWHHCQLMYMRSYTLLTAPSQTRSSEFHGTGWPRTFSSMGSHQYMWSWEGDHCKMSRIGILPGVSGQMENISFCMKERTQRALKVVELNTHITGQGNRWCQGHSDQVQDIML